MHKLWLNSFLGLFVLVLLCSCNDDRKQNQNYFYYNESSGLASLDPAFAKNKQVMWAVHQVYNTLVEVDDSLKIKPSIAKSWTISADNLTFTFLLRDDVYFVADTCFSGKRRKLIAADVVYSLNRIIDKSVASPGAWIFNNRVDSIQPFLALNDSTFQLKLQQPFQSILGILSMQYCSVVPMEAVEFYGKDFRRHPVGTGPFSFVAWEEGQALILKKNPTYFEKDNDGSSLPYLEGVKVSFYNSKATEFLEFQQHKLDFIDDIDASFKDEVLTKTGQLKKAWHGKIQLQKQPYLNIEYLGILMDSKNANQNKSLADKKVRQAINFAIDRRKMMLYLRNSIGVAAESGFVPCGLPSFDSAIVKGYQFNPQRAKQLLKEANYNNEPIKLLTIPIYADLGSFIVNELQQLGINASVEVVQKSLLLEQTAKNIAPFFRGSWIADYPDAENYLSVFYGKNPSPPNYTRYQNSAYDKLYDQALAEKDNKKRYLLYQAMDRMIIEDAPVVPLWYDMAIHLVHNNVKDFPANSLNLLELRRVKKK